MDDEVEVLHGGVANAGAVVRAGDHVLRPGNEHSDSILRFLAELRTTGFAGAPAPVGRESDGRERLTFIPGQVAIPPYPDWVQTDAALASITRLLRSFHDAARQVDTTTMSWSAEMVDPQGGVLVCHNDVCLENVVFRDGHAVALLDFDFAAPGRAAYDVAAFARMCVPIDDDVNPAKLGWHPNDRPRRLRLVCDTYGLDTAGRAEVLACLDGAIERGGEFVRRHVEAGEPGFVTMWEEMGGMERFDRRRAWWADSREEFAAALA